MKKLYAKKSLELKHVVEVVLKCVNRIRARALNRREFRQFLNDVEQEHCEPWMHSTMAIERHSPGPFLGIEGFNSSAYDSDK